MKKLKTGTESVAATAGCSKPRVRDRIFETACSLFYRQGIRTVGVDAIANEAGTNKMSFYRSFESKDALVADYLRDQAELYWRNWNAIVEPFRGNPMKQVERLFEAHLSKDCGEGGAGCALGNAAVELRSEPHHPGFAVIAEHKARQREMWHSLAKELGAYDPQALGDGLMLLLEGSALTRMVFPCRSGPLCHALDAARALIRAYCAPQGAAVESFATETCITKALP